VCGHPPGTRTHSRKHGDLATIGIPEDIKKVLVAGDWHGNTTWMRQVLTCAARDGYKVIVHVGDLKVFGRRVPGLSNRRIHRRFARCSTSWAWCSSSSTVTTTCTRLRALPVNDGFGVISDRLLYAPRGHRWQLGGVRFGALGGAYSIDRYRGREGWDWFVDEATVPGDVEVLGTERLDVLITHDVPAGIDVLTSMDIPEAIERESYIVPLSAMPSAAQASSSPPLASAPHRAHARMETRVHVPDKEFVRTRTDLATLQWRTSRSELT
jgi:hypothetical protein